MSRIVSVKSKKNKGCQKDQLSLLPIRESVMVCKEIAQARSGYTFHLGVHGHYWPTSLQDLSAPTIIRFGWSVRDKNCKPLLRY